MTFEEYATARLGPLLRAATVVCGDATLAEDLVQDVLVKVHVRWETVAAARVPDAYVRRMLVNEFLSWRRKWARITPRAVIDVGVSDDDPAERLVEHDQLTRALARLPRRQRVVLALRYFEDLSDEQIADALGCAAVTVRSHASRALAALRAGDAARELVEDIPSSRTL